MLPLHAAPPAIREVELRRLRRRRMRPRRSGEKIAAAIARIGDEMGRAGRRRRASGQGRARDRFPTRTTTSGTPCNRTALAEGFDTESMDGSAVAPLMGDYQDADVGVLRHAQHAELLGARELRPRGRDAHAARRAAQDADAQLLARASGRARRRRTTSSSACCPSGISPTSRIGTSASGSRRASNRSATSPARCRSARNTTSTRSSAGTCGRCGRRSTPRARGPPRGLEIPLPGAKIKESPFEGVLP